MLFADDTNIFVSHKDKDCLTIILNAELNKLSIWFRANRLSLNLKKYIYIYIVFRPCQKRTNQTIQLLIINSQKIDQVKETVFLGNEKSKFKLEIRNLTCHQ